MQQQQSAVMLGKSVVYYPEDGEAKTTYEVYRNGGYLRRVSGPLHKSGGERRRGFVITGLRKLGNVQKLSAKRNNFQGICKRIRGLKNEKD